MGSWEIAINDKDIDTFPCCVWDTKRRKIVTTFLLFEVFFVDEFCFTDSNYWNAQEDRENKYLKSRSWSRYVIVIWYCSSFIKLIYELRCVATVFDIWHDFLERLSSGWYQCQVWCWGKVFINPTFYNKTTRNLDLDRAAGYCLRTSSMRKINGKLQLF